MKHISNLVAYYIGMVLMPSLLYSQEPVKPKIPFATVKHSKADEMSVKLIKNMAKPLSQFELGELKLISLPPVVDYSQYVTLVRDQSVTPNCCIFAVASVVDIIKEKERKYTPDVSEGFISYGYAESIQYYPDDARINIPADGQAGVIKNLGTCTEARLSSRNSDPQNLGNIPAPSEIPSDSNINDAHWLKIKDHAVKIFKKEDGLNPLKAQLTKGPVVVLYDIQSHCMALIGYNDNTSTFTFQNSWGESTNRGFVTWTYNEMLNRLPNIFVTVIDNEATSPLAYPYVARLKIHTPQGRNNLTIKIGVEGQNSSTVWAPSPYGFIDGGIDLMIDVPLPDYAGGYWPPNEHNQWLGEVSYGGQSGCIVNELTFVKRSFNSNGTYLPHVVPAPVKNYNVRTDKPEIIYIPYKKDTKITISHNAGSNPVLAGQNILFNGVLLNYTILSNTRFEVFPFANQVVKIWKVKSDPIEGWITEKLIGKINTNALGKFELLYEPVAPGLYKAYATTSEGLTIAISQTVKVY
jgi:hypothetical protein